jgi:exodeoxyribonuclease V alpha subunit
VGDSLFEPDDRRQLIGTIVAVRHHNPQDGWTVARLQVTEGSGAGELCAAVGCIANAREGMDVKLWGQWATHPVYGDQFRFDRYEIQQPLHADAIQRALRGGLIKGIGPATAEVLVKHFGEDLLHILDETPGQLRQVPGIGPKKAKAIADGWQAYRESDTQRTLMRLQGMDISAAFAIRIFRQYGEGAIAVVENNPYQLAIEVDGIGFKTADRIARTVGTPRTSPFRLQAGLSFALQEAAQQGHCYLPREPLLQYAAQLLECDDAESLSEACDALLRQGWAVAERLPAPASAEAADHPTCAIYLPRLWKAEQGTAGHLARIMRSGSDVKATGASLETWLEGERRVGEASLSAQQAEAVRLALTEKVVVLTGGPGVGKTTVTRAIVEVFENAKCRVLLASPTGRAAKRLSEVTGRPAKTIHRLLEIDPKEWVFRRNESNPLEGDVLIVDEASMIDIDLMHALTRAVPDQARLILVGDVDQLPSVGPGLVLRDLIDSQAVPVARLTEIFRQDRESQIVMNAYRVNAGQQPVFNPQPRPDDDCVLIQEANPERMVQHIVRVVGQALRADGFSPSDIQVLTPMNKRNLGTQRLNGVLQEALNPPTLGVRELRRGEKLLREGDRVVQTVNNYEKNVFNGDIGTIVGIEPGGQKLSVQFSDVSAQYTGEELDELELAYALTVHKAQGSEYPAVVLVCHTSQYVMLQRNLLYTGLTRARKKCVFVGNRQAIFVAVRNNRPTRRFTRLKGLL